MPASVRDHGLTDRHNNRPLEAPVKRHLSSLQNPSEERDERCHASRPDTDAVQAWVLAFAEGWRAPASADAFADHFRPWFDPRIRLIQPRLPTLVGRRAFRERFARPLFALIPDLHGQVERTAVGADCAYVELTLRGTLGGRPVAWRVCDRTSLRDGLVVERESYFDPLPLLRAILTRPRAWPALARTQLKQRLRRAARTDEHDAATTGGAPARATDDQRADGR